MSMLSPVQNPEERQDVKILAVVASYNRRESLREVVESLLGQTRPPQAILVVDNASIDGSAELVQNYYPNVLLFSTGGNLGGAGAFAWGVELASAMGFDGAWLMDDDAIPETRALEHLAEHAHLFRHADGIGFLSSIPVRPDGELGTGNYPEIERYFPSAFAAAQRHLIAARRASFVGVLVNLHVARAGVGLPNPDFFIWGDDTDYTSRLSRKAGGASHIKSLIFHESMEVEAIDQRKAIGWKYFYLLRNNIWQARWAPDGAYRIAKIRQAGHALINEVLYSDSLSKVLGVTCRAARQGLLKRRRDLRVGDLLRSSPSAREWVRLNSAVADGPGSASMG